MTGTRRDIASLGTWSDELVWYALAVGELRSRALNQRTSWTYLAAIHGIDPQGWLDQGIIAPGTPAPSADEQRRMFNQCQHAGWFFLPWHRGYLAAFEQIVGDWIASRDGPTDWALPYWNYLNDHNPDARAIPLEFRDPTLPAHPAVTTPGTPNPLADARRGPALSLGPQSWLPADIDLLAQTGEAVYTSEPGTLGYGGPISGFDQQGNAYGAVESNPHNFVHVMIGGAPTPDESGWMVNPDFAALDPIFWLHHCNIDRLWAAWMSGQGNAQESSQPWRNGPFPRQFAMPMPDGGLEVFVPEDTLAGERLEPRYDSLTSGTGITAAPDITAAATTPPPGVSTLIAANDQVMTIGNDPVSAAIALDDEPGSAVSASPERDRVFLNVEGVRGSMPSGVLIVTLTAPDAPAAERIEQTVVFFGLHNATATHGPHAGNGLSATVDVTDGLRRLRGALASGMDALRVELAQPVGASKSPISVDRVSLYRRQDR